MTKVISAMLGAAAMPSAGPSSGGPRVSPTHADWRVMLEPEALDPDAPAEQNEQAGQPHAGQPHAGLADVGRRWTAHGFAASFPTQSARAALLDECVVKAQERANLIKAATRP
jgi:hypothetical protein